MNFKNDRGKYFFLLKLRKWVHFLLLIQKLETETKLFKLSFNFEEMYFSKKMP